MKYVDFLKLNLNKEEEIDVIMEYTLDFLDEINVSDFKGGQIHKLKGIIEKSLYLAIHYNIKDTHELTTKCKDFINTVIKGDNTSPAQRRDACLSPFEELYSAVNQLYNELRHTRFENLFEEFLLIYNPDKSNKEKAIELIHEVVDLLNKDSSLPVKQKKQILKQLHKILANLTNNKTNWSACLGDIHQTIIIMGALGSLIGGIAGTVALSVNDKLTKSINVIQSTSVTLNIDQSLKVIETNYFQGYLESENKDLTLPVPLLEGKKK